MTDNKIEKDIIKELTSKFSASLLSEKKDIPYWISTGCTLLDYCIREHGIPGGRITEITGESSVGKSALCFSLIANVQKMGGIAVLIDTEASADLEFAGVFGVDCERLLFDTAETVEDLYKKVNLFIDKIREKTDAPILIIADSCCPSTKVDFDKLAGENPKIASNAVAQRTALKKLVTKLEDTDATLVGINHIVANPGANPAFGEPKKVSTGGSAWQFYPHLRIKLRGAKKVVGENKDGCVGIITKAIVAKSKVGVPFKETEMHLMYASGYDDVASLVAFASDMKVFGSSRGWYEWKSQDQTKYPKLKWRLDKLEDMFRDSPTDLEVLKGICREYYYEIEPVRDDSDECLGSEIGNAVDYSLNADA